MSHISLEVLAEAEIVHEHAVTPSVKSEAMVMPATPLGSIPSSWSSIANCAWHASGVGRVLRDLEYS